MFFLQLYTRDLCQEVVEETSMATTSKRKQRQPLTKEQPLQKLIMEIGETMRVEVGPQQKLTKQLLLTIILVKREESVVKRLT